MKLNERLYEELGSLPYKEPKPGEDYVPVPSTPIECQNVNGHEVEVYYMNEYKDVLEEFTKQGKFAVWSSKDGVNYRLAVEKDYYAKLNELYTVDVNKEWLGFWDNCEKMQKGFSRKIVIPVTIVVVILFLFLANWNKMFTNAQMSDTLSMVFTIAIPLVYLVGMLFVRKTIINNITKEQQKALERIKTYLGEEKYESLLKDQRTYIDEYFDSHYTDENEENENSSSETNTSDENANTNEDTSTSEDLISTSKNETEEKTEAKDLVDSKENDELDKKEETK